MLLNLPSELIKAISANLETTADKNALILTCRWLYYTLNDDMYRDVVRAESMVEQNAAGLMPMQWAAANGREVCIKSLLAHGADPRIFEPRDCETPQAPKASFADHGTLLTRPSPLIYAAVGGHAGVAKLLIDAGANVNASGGLSEHPIIVAVTYGHVHDVRVFLDARAKLNLRVRGGTLLSYAASKGHIEVVKLLLAARGSIFWEHDEGRGALEEAIQNGHQDVVRFLVQTGIGLAQVYLPPSSFRGLHKGDK
ncbi:ankyrin repeat-containing domain protein [Aspergillus germanicus]